MSTRMSMRSSSRSTSRSNSQGHGVRPSSSPMGRVPLANAAVFVNGKGRVHMVPLNIINRPIMPEIDEEKVTIFMEDMEAGDDFPPIEVLRVVLPPDSDDPGSMERRYYFSFGGCHRYEACRRLGRQTIKCKIIDVQGHIIRQHLGASCPF